MPTYRFLVEVNSTIESPDEIQAQEDIAVKLIHMIRNDEIAINMWPINPPSDTDRSIK